jgi:hypothetical protein
MSPIRSTLGVCAGAFLVLSSAAHSLLGWPEMAAELSKTNAPADLTRGLAIGWHFGGVAMLVFGVLVLRLFLRARKDESVSLGPSLLIGGAYAAFGLGALAISGLNPFYLVFIVPGTTLVLTSLRRSSNRRT